MTGRARRQQRKRARIRAELDWEVMSVRERERAYPDLDVYSCTQDTLAEARRMMRATYVYADEQFQIESDWHPGLGDRVVRHTPTRPGRLHTLLALSVFASMGDPVR
jgi:hypothetical protein